MENYNGLAEKSSTMTGHEQNTQRIYNKILEKTIGPSWRLIWKQIPTNSHLQKRTTYWLSYFASFVFVYQIGDDSWCDRMGIIKCSK